MLVFCWLRNLLARNGKCFISPNGGALLASFIYSEPENYRQDQHYLIFLLLLLSNVTVLSAQSTAEQRSKVFAAVDVIEDFTALKEQPIPASMLTLAEGLVIIPGLKKAGFVVAGKRGKGVAIVRDEAGNWSYPAFVTLTGGSFGFQVGVQSTDLVLIIRDRETSAS